MTSLLAKSLRVVMTAMTLAVVASGCLRLSAPDYFICKGPADCEAEEKCDFSRCRPKDWCQDHSQCEVLQACSNGKCVAAQCDSNAEEACGAFRCNNKQCYTSCSGAHQCRSGFVCLASACVVARSLPNASACNADADCLSSNCCGPRGSARCSAACLPSGTFCVTDAECESGYCCRTTGTTSCGTGPCTAGINCASDAACGAGKCVAGKCLLGPGAACAFDGACASGACVGGLCRGSSGLSEACSSDSDCETGRPCCATNNVEVKKCGELGKGCKGAIGDACMLGGANYCSSKNCLSYSFCSQTCANDSDCGINPWGSQNYCMKNGSGNDVCFSGCDENDCAYLGDSFDCFSAPSVDQQPALVCVGNGYTPAPLQLF